MTTRGWQGMRDGWAWHTHDLFTVRARARRKTFFVVFLLLDSLTIDHRIVHVRRAERWMAWVLGRGEESSSSPIMIAFISR